MVVGKIFEAKAIYDIRAGTEDLENQITACLSILRERLLATDHVKNTSRSI